MAAVDLYWFELAGNARQLATWRAWLSQEERARADRFLLPLHGERYIAAHGQLRAILAERLGCAPAEVEFAIGTHGKPALAGGELRFNLSHSGGWGLVGLHPEMDLGVDIEAERPQMDGPGLAKRFFGGRETAWLRAQPVAEQPRAFARLWTCKEAWLKADGRGLSLALHRIEVDLAGAAASLRWLDAPGQSWFVRELELTPGYAAAVVLPGAAVAVRVQRLTPATGAEPGPAPG